MRPLVARWYAHDEHERVTLHTPAEIDAMLDAMPAAPTWRNVATIRLHGSVPGASQHMTVGVAGHAGSVCYGVHYGQETPGSDRGAWFSLGEPDATGQVEYWDGVDGHHVAPASSVIPLDRIRRAVHEFAATGRRPTAVAWQDARPALLRGADDAEDPFPA